MHRYGSHSTGSSVAAATHRLQAARAERDAEVAQEVAAVAQAASGAEVARLTVQLAHRGVLVAVEVHPRHPRRARAAMASS